MATRELAERVMIERKLDASDTTHRNSVVFKVVQALRHAKQRKLVRMVEKRKGMCVWAAGDAGTLRPVALVPVILEPGSVGRIGAQVGATDPVVLATDHAPQPGEKAFCMIGVNTALAVGVKMIDALDGKICFQEIPVRGFVG